MPLLLRIENMDRLPDGGPVRHEIDRRGLDIGRDPYLDWTLPDPERFISGKHCEIRYRDGGYWLHDVSTNGTSVNGRGGRLTEPHRLQDGDRIHIGQYIVAVELSGEEPQAGATDASAPPTSGVADPWGGIDNAAAAIDRRDFAAHARAQGAQPAAPGQADLAEEDISWGVGRVTPGAPPAADDVWGARPSAGAGAAAADEWGWTPPAPSAEASAKTAADAPMQGAGSVVPAERSAQQADPFSGVGAGPAPESVLPAITDVEAAPRSEAPAPQTEPFSADAAERDKADAPPAPAGAPLAAASGSASGLASRWADGAGVSQARPATAATQRAAGQGGDFVAAFERGAGMPAGSVAGLGDEALAEELGRLFKLVTQHLQAMLAARAETKSAMRSSERTMIGALENNPLKFSPTPEDALRIMFGAKSRSYLDAGQTVESSFRDLQSHQVQTFVAMQQALQALVEDLDPASIEGATSTDGGLAGIVGSRRAKFWDTYVERFRAKSARHERGLIDAFMVLFAEMYDRQR